MTELLTRQLYIDGEFCDSSNGETAQVTNPATEQVIGEVPLASIDDVSNAIAAAHAAFDDGAGEWPQMSGAERSKYLHAFCDALEADKAALVDIAVREMGSTQMIGDLMQVQSGIDVTRYWADQAASFEFEEPLPPTNGPMGAGQVVVRKEPIGVVSAITPFNYPLLLSLWKFGPALAMGNTMVLKPSPYTPLSGLVLGDAAKKAGIPKGVFNVVTGNDDAAKLLTTDERVAMVSFTGSDIVGRKVQAQAADTLKRVVLELGGKSPVIVFADTDLDDPMFMQSLLMFIIHCGQGCVLSTRLLIESSIHDEVVGRIKYALDMMKVGDPSDPEVMMGPLISEAQRERVERYIKLAQEEGATVAYGGGRPAGLDKGFFVEPTLLTGVDNAMKVAQDEIFGPVGCVIPFEGTEEAIRIANDTRYGLGAAVWSGDKARAFEVANAIRAGMVTVNGGDKQPGGPIGPAPFGGYKHSGLGREHGTAGAHEFLELKTVTYPIG